MKSFTDLKVWQKAHELVLAVYQVTAEFPNEERFGLTSQIRRAAVSVPANIVEGFKRKGKGEFLHFLNMADSSLEEPKYFLILARDLKYIDEAKYTTMIAKADEVGRMLAGLQKSIEKQHG